MTDGGRTARAGVSRAKWLPTPIVVALIAILGVTAGAFWATGSSFTPALAERLPILRVALALALFAVATLALTGVWSRTTDRLRRRW